jgi:hypothetical protein
VETVKLGSAEKALLDQLARLVGEGGERNLLMVSVDPVHMQFAAGKGDERVRCEAVASRHLPRSRRLSPDAEELLAQAGCELTPDRSFYAREFAAGAVVALRDVAFVAMRMLAEIYGCGADEPVALRCLLDAGTARH